MCKEKKRTCTSSIELIWSIVRRRKKNVCQPHSPPLPLSFALSLFSSSINHDRRSKQYTFYANIDLRQHYKVQVDVKIEHRHSLGFNDWFECINISSANVFIISPLDRSKVSNIVLIWMCVVIRSSQKSVITLRSSAAGRRSIVYLSACEEFLVSPSNKCISWTPSSINNSILTLDRSITRVFDNGNQVRLISHLVDTCWTNVQ